MARKLKDPALDAQYKGSIVGRPRNPLVCARSIVCSVLVGSVFLNKVSSLSNLKRSRVLGDRKSVESKKPTDPTRVAKISSRPNWVLGSDRRVITTTAIVR